MLPSILLSYLGQGASLLQNPDNYYNPFFTSVPTVLFWPVFIVAVVVTLISAHSTVNSTFDLISQAIALDYFPNLPVKYTSKTNRNQVFVPAMNLIMLCTSVLLVITFETSFNLSNAYGMSISIVMILTSVLISIAAWVTWRVHWIIRVVCIFLFLLLFLPFEILFLFFNSLKVPLGGYVPLMLGMSCAFVMLVWTYGQDALRTVNTRDVIQTYDEFATRYESLHKSNGIGVFMVNNAGGVPAYLLQYVDTVDSVPQVILFLSIIYFKIPYVTESKRMSTVFINDNMIRVTARYGFMEKNISLPHIIDRVVEKYDLSKFVKQVRVYTPEPTPDDKEKEANDVINEIVVQQQNLPLQQEDIMEQKKPDIKEEAPKQEDSKPTRLSTLEFLKRRKSWDSWIIDLVENQEESKPTSIYYFLTDDYVKVDRKRKFYTRWIIIFFLFLRAGTRNNTQRMQIPPDKVIEIGNNVRL
ncbi:hypothetical protein AKO1_007294 [Acrasis kona]|uniref:Potassium transporter n=1 Tax=Acrasis kona TaxID=1008807 RepID=A0AAW2YZJ6_9EUKA